MTAFIGLGVRALVLLSLAWIGAILLRRYSASIRASLWTAAFAAVLLLPAVSILGPAWRVPILAAPEATPVEFARSAREESAAPRVVNVGDGSPSPVMEAAASDGSAATLAAPGVSWTVVALAIVAVVTGILLVRIAAAYRRMRQIASRAVAADDDWAVVVDEVRNELGIVQPIAVRVTGATNVPAVTGFSLPVLLLPMETDDWPLDVRRAVVLHELAHVVRRDSVSQLISQIACAIYWFVPLAWYGARRGAAFRERASDDVVIQAGVRPSAYAQSLLVLARSSSHTLQSPAAMAMAESRIHERIRAILAPSVRREQLTWRSALTMLALTFGATAIVGAIEPAERAVASRDAATPVTAATQAAAATPPPVVISVAPGRAEVARPGAAPMAVVQTDRLCGGAGLDKSSSSIQEDDNQRRWTVRLSGPGCSVDLRAEGKFEFTADFTDIARIDANGFFRVDVTDRGVRRQLEIESKNGTLSRTWRVDGRESPYDAAARAWFAAFLIELDRRTAIGVDIRLPILVRQGGVDAVLKETALMSSDYARSQYYLKLPKATKVTPDETTRLLRQAGSLSGSDHYLAEIVRAYAANVQDTTVRSALVELLERMKSDHYLATSVETIMGDRAPGPAEMDVLVRVVPRMSSDHYKTQILMKVLKAPSLSSGHRATIATTSAAIDSDHYAAEVLEALARKGLGDDAIRRAFFDAASKVDSDHYHAAVLTAVLGGPSLAERDLIDVVASSKGIDSDHYQAEVLERVARHTVATDRVKTAVLDASAGMSSHYAEQVRRAGGR